MNDFALSTVVVLIVFVWCSSNVNGDGVCVSVGRQYNSTVSDAFGAKALTTSIKLGCNPYIDDSCALSPTFEDYGNTTVCGVIYADASRIKYSFLSYKDAASAHDAGAYVTHLGACGACSTLNDLAVYMNTSDLTEAARACGIKGLLDPQKDLDCLLGLGFTYPCAQIWQYNTQNTRAYCQNVCFRDYFQYYNNQTTCKLNDCLQCDEDKSGPIFKQFSGRTRRNSGLFSAIYRPPATVANLTHDYY